MAKNVAQQAAQKKAAKQKKLLAILSVPLLAALVFALMPLFKGNSSTPEVSGTPAAATTPVGSIPNAASAVPVTPGIAALPVDSLRAFVALGRKDPFHDGGPGAASSSTSNPSSKPSKPQSKPTNPKQPPAPPTGATIALDGSKLALTKGQEFGHAPGLAGVPLFRLVSLTRTTAVVGVVGTNQQFTLHVNVPLTLEQNGGWKYTLLLEPQGTGAPMKISS
jgi:hypothetical protein